MRASEVSCVEPYLVDKLITFLSVLVLIFSASLLAVLSAYGSLLHAYFIFQLSIIVKVKFHTSDIEFLLETIISG